MSTIYCEPQPNTMLTVPLGNQTCIRTALHKKNILSEFVFVPPYIQYKTDRTLLIAYLLFADYQHW